MLINWKKIAEKVYNSLKKEVLEFSRKPKLWIILVWNNASSLRYIWQKEKWANFVWIDFKLQKFEDNISEKDLIEEIEKFNNDKTIDGFMIQLPLPKYIDEKKIINKINPLKDVDWFSPTNQGKVLLWDKSWFIPCTPAGIMEILKEEKINLEWKNVCVIWKSNIVWKPLVSLLMNASATVFNCNSKTINLKNITRIADIVIIAIWKPQFLKSNMLKENSIVIDVWFTVIDGKIYWDAKTETINKIWHKITPVPGWVWPLTVAMLMKNTIKAYKKK